jgi:DNA-binding ferritin-like protein (Dps family)
MVNVVNRQVEYLLTESDMRQQLGKILPDRFIKDYVSIKRNMFITAQQTDSNTQTIETLDARLDILEPEVAAIDARLEVAEAEIISIDGRLFIAEGEIAAIDIRLTTAEGEIVTLRTDFDAHIAEESAHGATGNIVGTDDYASSSVGGTVLLAASVADAATSTVTPPAALAAAGAAYVQAYAQSQTDAINALSTALAQLVLDHNALKTQFNALLASERTAKQLAP